MPADVNSVNEEIKNEARKVWQTKTGLERVKYFVYYYKWWVIGIAVVGLMVGSMVHDFATRKESVFQVMVVNGEYDEYYDYKSLIDEFAKTVEYDPKKEEVILDSSAHVDIHAVDQMSQMTVQKIFLNVAAKELDVLICDKELMELTCSQSCAYDLEEILSPELLEKYKDQIYWFDMSTLPSDDITALDDPDAETPELSEEERYKALSIDVSDFYKIKETNMFPYNDGEAYAVIPVNTMQLENAIAFLEYLDRP